MSSGQRILETTLAKVILVSVDDHRPADDRVVAVEGDLRIGDGGAHATVFTSNHVAEIADVTVLI